MQVGYIIVHLLHGLAVFFIERLCYPTHVWYVEQRLKEFDNHTVLITQVKDHQHHPKEYAEKRMALLKERFPKVTKVAIVIDVDVKKHMYMAEVVANRLGETAVGAKEFSESAKSVIDAAAARAERQLLRMRVKARKGTVRKQRAASAKN